MSTTGHTARVTAENGRWQLHILGPDNALATTDPQPGPRTDDSATTFLPHHWDHRLTALGYRNTGTWTDHGNATQTPCEPAPTARARRDDDGSWTLTIERAPDGAPTGGRLQDNGDFSQRDFLEHLRLLGYYTSDTGAVLRLDGTPWTEQADGSWTTPVHTVTSIATHTATVRPLDGRWTLEVAGKRSQLGEDHLPFGPSRASAALITAGYEIPGLEYHRTSTTGPWTPEQDSGYTAPCYPSSRRTT